VAENVENHLQELKVKRWRKMAKRREEMESVLTEAKLLKRSVEPRSK
jgi:hypothetical protein